MPIITQPPLLFNRICVKNRKKKEKWPLTAFFTTTKGHFCSLLLSNIFCLPLFLLIPFATLLHLPTLQTSNFYISLARTTFVFCGCKRFVFLTLLWRLSFYLNLFLSYCFYFLFSFLLIYIKRITVVFLVFSSFHLHIKVLLLSSHWIVPPLFVLLV